MTTTAPVPLVTIPCIVCGGSIHEATVVYTEFGLNVVRCLCGLVYVNPRLADGALDEVYGRHGTARNVHSVREDRTRDQTTYLAVERRLVRQRLSRIERLRGPGPGKVLDIGCQHGDFVVHAKSRGWRAVGVEISREIAERTRQQHGVAIYNEKIEDVDFRGEQFDLVTLFDVLEHLQDPNRALAVIRSILKPDGLLIIKVPNVTFILLKAFVLSRLLGRDAHEKYDFVNPLGYFMVEQHNYNFSDATLTRLLAKHGFVTVRSYREFPSIYGTSRIRDLVQIGVWGVGVLVFYLSLGRLNINRSLLYAFKKAGVQPLLRPDGDHGAGARP